MKKNGVEEIEHIGMVVPSLDRVGGYEKQAISMAKAFHRLGKRVTLISENLGSYPTFEHQDGLEIFRFYPLTQKFTGTFELELRSLMATKLGRNMDVLHCHAFEFLAGWMIPIARRYRIPSLVKVATEQDVLKFQRHIHEKTPGFLEIYLNLQKADTLISLNQNIKRELIRGGFLPEKIKTLPNGVDTERFAPATSLEKRKLKELLGLPTEKFILTYSGRFEERKRVPDLLEAWIPLAPQLKDWHLVLIGEGETWRQCQERLDHAGLHHQVTLTGTVDNVDQYLKATDLYVFPSRLEGMPNVILEAMATGLPIIATEIPGVTELIIPGRNGILVQPQDPAGLREAIEGVIQSAHLRAKLGEAARSKALEAYSFDRLCHTYLECYRQMRLS